jgi:hypothetical protein
MLSYLNVDIESVLKEIIVSKNFDGFKTLSPKLVLNLYKSLKFVIPKNAKEVMIILPLKIYEENDVESLKTNLESDYEVEIFESSMSENIMIFYK